MWYIVYKNEEKTYRIESDDYESMKQDFEDLQKVVNNVGDGRELSV